MKRYKKLFEEISTIDGISEKKFKKLYEKEEYGIQWTEFDKNDHLIKKQKIFKSKDQLDKFVIKIEKKDNFNAFEAWL